MVARLAVAMGIFLVVAGFCLGVDTPGAVSVAGERHACAEVITPGMLVSGQSGSSGRGPGTPEERRLAARVRAACGPTERRADWAVAGGIGVGVVVLLAGWTVLSERDRRSSAVLVATATG